MLLLCYFVSWKKDNNLKESNNDKIVHIYDLLLNDRLFRFINFVRIVNIRDKYSVPKMWNIQIKYLDIKSIYVEKYRNQIIH